MLEFSKSTVPVDKKGGSTYLLKYDDFGTSKGNETF